MPVCVKCLDDLPEQAFGVQALKIDNRPGRKPRANVRNSRCLECDSRAQRKDGGMGTPAEIEHRWRNKVAPTAANQNERKPDGFIMSENDGLAFWLPPGKSAADIGLINWRLMRSGVRRA